MRIGIAGLGLIGGSLALALREKHDVRGYDVDPSARRAAAASGIAVVDTTGALLPAELVVVATPLRSVIPVFAALAPAAGGAVLADVASVRGPIDAFAREHAEGARIVGLHPMAGSARRGFAAADRALFQGHTILVVPTATSDDDALALVRAVAQDAGGVPVTCASDVHDRRVALTSGLPLAAAIALAAVADELGDDLVPFTGPGFRDTTRLADTSADLAEALLLANAGNVVAALGRLRGALDAIEGAVAERDASALRALLQRATAVRARLCQDIAARVS